LILRPSQGQLLAEERVDRLESGDLAALELTQQMLEDLERTRHLEADQVLADAVQRRGSRGAHRGKSWAASRRPMVS
jgi:hypothetical protein